MLDSAARKLIDPPLNAVAARISPILSANSITIIGFFIGIASFIAITQGQLMLALFFLLLNRLADGLDGAVARQSQATDLGGYWDIVSDFILGALLPLGFALLAPENAFAAALLLSSFAMSMTVFLAFAIQAEKRGITDTSQGVKSFTYLAGLAEGTETIGFFVLVMLLPATFSIAALIFAGFVYLSVLVRLIVSLNLLREE